LVDQIDWDRIARFHLWGIHRHGGEVGWYDRRVGLRVMKRQGRGRDTLGGGKTELLLNLLWLPTLRGFKAGGTEGVPFGAGDCMILELMVLGVGWPGAAGAL
jgi:hypothetical protein